MKFTAGILAAFVAAARAAVLPDAFTLVADGGYTVLTDGTNAFIGADSNTHPILILKKNGDMLTYTAQGQPPTAFQNLYVIQNDVQPIALTVPHSGAAPQGANFTGFGVNDDGYFTFNGAPAFATDPAATGAKEIFYAGLPNSKYQQTMLWVKECKGC
ncbi:hypothetical protein M432DRAFT_617619 [Thermoascus aurantiacus ATCC 26904]